MARRHRLLPRQIPSPRPIGFLTWNIVRPPRLLLLAGLFLGLSAGLARAQSPSPNQPLAIDGLPPAPCPLLVPAADSALQPLRILPSQVARKNAIGCLSPADAAVYGPDGCPVKLCHPPQGTMPLPAF